jgi:hypothetical protein
VTFSRCRRAPRMRTVGEQGGPGGALVEPQSGAGCRVHVLELSDGIETAPPIPAPRGASDTSPSMWHGQITFARRSPAHGEVWQILTWTPGAHARLRTLPHGRIPACPETHGCKRAAQGTVAALDRDGALVTFLWEVPGGEGVVGEGAWELRVDRSDGSRATLMDGGFGHEACTGSGARPHELEYVWPQAPIADGGVALFGELYAFTCFDSFASVLGSHGTSRGPASLGKLERITLATALDGGTLYGLVPAGGARVGADSPGCDAAAPCSIEALATPPLRREKHVPFVPFQ